ncbi:MAG TPA: biliverdin-producing heme oxygenase [Miltoncostaea sp.]|nr:biliverdin-producing heme oxygenase [Miltoncostaea sp.]
MHTPGGGGAIVLSVPGGRRQGPRRRRGGGLSGPLSDRLARGTAPLHEHVDGRLDLPDGIADRAHYRLLLGAMLRAWDAVERTLATSGAAQALGLDAIRRSDALRDDLAVLGGSPAPADRPAAAMGVAEGVGTIYVLEGSALGGPVIAPLLERHLGLSAGEGTSFFRGLGPGTARRWSDVQARIDAWGRGCAGAEVDRAVWAAQLTFAIVGGAMAGALAAPPAP